MPTSSHPLDKAFETVAIMETVVGTEDYETVRLLGYNIPGDGGGGDFYWIGIGTATYTANRGTIIIVVVSTVTKGYWIRLVDQSDFISVIGFGAIGIGGSDDTIVIQTALDAWPNILFPQWIPHPTTPVKYYSFGISDMLYVKLDWAYIKGKGTISQLSGSDGVSMFVVSASNVTFEDITLVGQLGTGESIFPNTRAGIYCLPSGTDPLNGLTVRGLTIAKQMGVHVRDCNNVIISDCVITYSQMGILLFHSVNTITPPRKYVPNNHLVKGNKVIIDTGAIAANTNVRGIHTTDAFNVIVDGNVSLGAQLSIELYTTLTTVTDPDDPTVTTPKATNYIISNNIVDRWISCVSGSSTVTDNIVDFSLQPVLKVTEESEGPLDYGIELVASINVTCTGNYVAHINGPGIFAVLPASTTSSAAKQLINGNISGNVIYKCGLGNKISPAISIGNASGLNVTGNLIDQCNASGIGIIGNVPGTSGGPVEYVNVVGNTIKDGYGYGIQTYYCRQINIKNNLITNQKTYSYMYTDDGGTHTVTVLGSGINVGYLATWAQFVTVENNECYENQGWGIYIETGSIQHLVTGNTTAGNAGGEIRTVIPMTTNIIGKIFNNNGTVTTNGLPISGTWQAGDYIPTDSSAFGGKKCIVTGTIGPLTGLTCSNTPPSADIKLSAFSDLFVSGQLITIGGLTGVFTILIVANTMVTTVLTLNTIIATSLSGPTATVNFFPAVFIDFNPNNTLIPNRNGVSNTDYTVLPTDYLIAYHTLTAARTVYLPDPTSALLPIANKAYIIKDESGNAGVMSVYITVLSLGSKTIDGATSKVINTTYGILRVYTDGANWFTF